MPRYSIFGFVVETDRPLRAFLNPAAAAADVVITRGPHPPDDAAPGYTRVYDSSLPGLPSEALFSLFRCEDRFKLRYSGTADFYLDANRIHCHLLDPTYDYWVDIAMLGPVMSLWLETRGLVALHASAVVVEGQAVGMVATSRSGKTSLAAAFMRAGDALLTDDILPIRPSDSGAMARSGYPQMRMWPDQAAQFIQHPETFPLAHPDFDKRRLPAAEIGPFHPTAAPLVAILLPQREDRDDVRVNRISGPEALFELLRGSFAASVIESMSDFQSRRLQTLAQIVAMVPVYRVHYPEGYDRLPRVCAELHELLHLQHHHA